MIVERIKSEIVSHISYFIGSNKEAIVVDPRRDCYIYFDIAQREAMNVKYIFETHRNEDYIIGSKELSNITGAEIYHGPWPEFKYGETLKDNQEFYFGNLKVTAIHTAGHTPGCMSYAVSDLESGEQPVLVCTGDTLFVNDVGRTDFGRENRREWSENLYNSIFNKLLPLGDHVILCPAHGAGSICGAAIAEREWSTLGTERLFNPVLQKSKEEFLQFKINEYHEYIPYFRTMEILNVEGAPFIEKKTLPKNCTPQEFKQQIDEGTEVIDIRSPLAFSGAHIKRSYSIPKNILSFIGWFLSTDRPLLVVTDNRSDFEYSKINLLRIGYEAKGYMDDGLLHWNMNGYPIEKSGLITVNELRERLESGERLTLLDVRGNEEWRESHIDGTENIYVGHLEDSRIEVQHDNLIVVVCNSGRRGSIASSILLRKGYRKVYNLLGGMNAWEKANYPISSY